MAHCCTSYNQEIINYKQQNNKKLDYECKKIKTTEVQDVGGSLGILQVGGNVSLFTAQPQKHLKKKIKL